MKTILIVEDMDMNLDLLVQLLEEEYVLLIARDGAEAVQMALNNQPDLILMDIGLPILDGYEATKQIHKQKPGLPVIGLSAHAMQGDAEKALQYGFTDYLTKPLDESLLATKLREYLGE